MDGCRCLLFLLLMLHSVCCVVIVSNRQPDALFPGACRFMAMHAAGSKVKLRDYYITQWDGAHLGLVEVACCRPTTGAKGSLDPFQRG
jgi:hypothetical protein